MNDTLELEETTITFEIVPATAGIAPDQKLSLERSFLPFFQELKTLKEAAAKVTNATEARAVRLALVKVRTGGDKVRKEMKEASLREGRAIDGANAILLHGLSPIEKAMELIETEEARKEIARVADLVAARTERLRAVGGMVPGNLSVLTDDQFESILKDAAELRRIKQEREAKEEADRLAKIEADRLERIRIDEENARLKAEAAETARLAKIEADRIAAERAEEARKAKAALEAKEAEAKAEADRVAKERAEEQRKAKEALAKAEEEAAKARQEAQAAADKAKAIADEQERTRKAEAAAAAKAAKAPDKDKLAAWLVTYKALALPAMTTPEGRHAFEKIQTVLVRSFGEINIILEDI